MTPDPSSLAAFWAAALGWGECRQTGHEILIADDDWGYPRFTFQRAEPSATSGRQPVHLDLTAGERAAEVARLQGLGATAVRTHGQPGEVIWTVMLDPDGNEFCVAEVPAGQAGGG
jgi:hypothetical protein